jgi:hypothetical protein
MRVLALARFRLRGSLSGSVLLAPLVVFALVQVVGVVGRGGQAAVQVTTAVAFAVPVLAWVARQVLDAGPDEQVHLSGLAVGGPARARVAGVLAAAALTVPAALLSAGVALAAVDGCGRPGGVVLTGLSLALTGAVAAVAIGALASRSVAGSQGGGVVVLAAAPVLLAVLSLPDSPWATALVPRLGEAVRLAYDTGLPPACDTQPLAAGGAGLVAQVALWSAVVLSAVLLRARRQL